MTILVPELSYKGLAIQEGEIAPVTRDRMVTDVED
jgi:hypothetical protein